ncbi:zinc ribbon domain-containing protein [Methanothrix soehngenii]
MNHNIANWIVSKPYDVIALEDLTNIRNGKKNEIDPRYTSRTCSKCGFQKKENRNGKTFKCKSCGFQIDADLNASRNIATFSRSDRSRLSVNQPIIAG